MKKIIILFTMFFTVFFISSVAQAESLPPVKLAKQNKENTPPVKLAEQEESSNKEAKNTEHTSPYFQLRKSSFFTLSIGNDFTPAEDFTHRYFSVYLRYGRYLSNQSFFSAGIKTSYSSAFNNVYFLQLKYGYDLVEHGAWIPGLETDISLGVGHKQYVKGIGSKRFLALGLGLGAYLKSFVTSHTALVLRLGAVNDNASSGCGITSFDLTYTRMYINLALQWHLSR